MLQFLHFVNKKIKNLFNEKFLWMLHGQGRFLQKEPLAAGGSRLLHPIHGRGVFQRSNVISNLYL
jgi:hypothetical protein